MLLNLFGINSLVEAAGIEPTSQGPKSWVLPLNDASIKKKGTLMQLSGLNASGTLSPPREDPYLAQAQGFEP